MKHSNFEKELSEIEIPPEINGRIRMGIMEAAKQTKRRRKVSLFVKSTVGTIVAASIAFVVLLNTNDGGFASSITGYSKDILNWEGAVVGTEYVEATEEIDVSLGQAESISNGINIPLTVVIKDETVPHYKPVFAEYVSLGEYKLINSDGKELDIDQAEISSNAVVPTDTEIIRPSQLLAEEPIDGIERLFKGTLTIKNISSLDSLTELNIQSFILESGGNRLEIKGEWKLPIEGE